MPARKQPSEKLDVDVWPHTERRNWYFDKRLSFDTIIAVVSMALLVGGPILIWGRAMESRVQALEVIQVERAKSEAQRDSDIRDQRVSLASRLDKLDEKVTQLQITVGQLLPFAGGAKAPR
jgi:hypothetical protein